MLKSLHKDIASSPSSPSVAQLTRMVEALDAAAERHLIPEGEEPTFAAIMVLMQVSDIWGNVGGKYGGM